MDAGRLPFRVVSLEASVPGGLSACVDGKTVRSGRIRLRLDDEAPPEASGGAFDYGSGTADVTFRLRVDFPEVRDALRWAGLDDEELPPARGVLRSRGKILEDHSLALAGTCDLAAHERIRAEALRAGVLPGT